MSPDQLGLDFGPEDPEPDFPAVRQPLTLNLEALAAMRAAWERVPVPRVKMPYRINRGSGWSNPDWRWRWECPCCTYKREDTDLAALMGVIDLHRCRARESLRWHPRYRMPPRFRK